MQATVSQVREAIAQATGNGKVKIVRSYTDRVKRSRAERHDPRRYVGFMVEGDYKDIVKASKKATKILNAAGLQTGLHVTGAQHGLYSENLDYIRTVAYIG